MNSRMYPGLALVGVAAGADGLPASLSSRQSGKAGSQSAQFESPGATRSMVRPYWLKPDDDSVAMLLLSHWPLEKRLAPPPSWM